MKTVVGVLALALYHAIDLKFLSHVYTWPNCREAAILVGDNRLNPMKTSLPKHAAYFFALLVLIVTNSCNKGVHNWQTLEQPLLKVGAIRQIACS